MQALQKEWRYCSSHEVNFLFMLLDLHAIAYFYPLLLYYYVFKQMQMQKT